MSQLFEPLRVGDLTLPNRIIMAPLTRQRASEGRVPNEPVSYTHLTLPTIPLV